MVFQDVALSSYEALYGVESETENNRMRDSNG